MANNVSVLSTIHHEKLDISWAGNWMILFVVDGVGLSEGSIIFCPLNADNLTTDISPIFTVW